MLVSTKPGPDLFAAAPGVLVEGPLMRWSGHSRTAELRRIVTPPNARYRGWTATLQFISGAALPPERRIGWITKKFFYRKWTLGGTILQLRRWLGRVKGNGALK